MLKELCLGRGESAGFPVVAFFPKVLGPLNQPSGLVFKSDLECVASVASSDLLLLSVSSNLKKGDLKGSTKRTYGSTKTKKNSFVTLRGARGKGRERTSSAEPTNYIILRMSV